jgi:hypothetical protein
LGQNAHVKRAIGCLKSHALGDGADQGRYVDPLPHELQAVSVEAREIHQVADHAMETLGRRVDPVSVLEELRLVGRAREHLRAERDRPERLPKVVRDDAAPLLPQALELLGRGDVLERRDGGKHGPVRADNRPRAEGDRRGAPLRTAHQELCPDSPFPAQGARGRRLVAREPSAVQRTDPGIGSVVNLSRRGPAEQLLRALVELHLVAPCASDDG